MISKESQQSKVLRVLKRNSKKGVANYEFHALHILSHTKVISDLRKEGHHIILERIYNNGKYYGVNRYHLVDDLQPKHKLFGVIPV